MRLLLLIVTALLAEGDIHIVFAADTARLVYAKNWKCLLDNIESYRTLASEPIIVYLALCPKVNPTVEGFAGSATNMGALPSVRVAQISNVLVLTKRELSCIFTSGARIACASKVNPNEELLELDFSKC
jgi:hypothetical protein